MLSIFSRFVKPRPRGAHSWPIKTELVAKAVSLFRSSPSLEHDEIFRRLVVAGAPHREAARLVEFLPIAYCHVLFPEVQFSQTFERRLPDGSTSSERLLSSEPIWNVAVAFASAEAERSTPRKDLLTVAAQSAEFSAMNDLLNRGSQLKDLRFTSVVLMWPENGPDEGVG